ncbi:TPA: hypothetical protein DEO28_02810 [Candidatus Dependentiae bacterium]|nr:MAG: hypothetical protein UR14_C0005G0086 [candidate division TM6 bacterium GW2011_GWE2_31_21]KKP53163.1 MAG: hypothetical protein UR43_C0007G0087 [candidate division TM6 bacterium GW2011_GWF2_33_332]HBS47982.1 hypothetical protein [Candidatus Dependentiae bacterium]HBZ73414.1 hypothetical protein [Candidatus Dependentiae bacterium]
MDLIVVTLGSFFTVISCCILAYVSMATGSGPWIAPTLVLISSFILKIIRSKISQEKMTEKIILTQTTGSIGGIVATGLGFTLPMLYFLNPIDFHHLLKSPIKFCIFIAITCLIAGGLGINLARIFSERLIYKENLQFPVSHMIYKIINTKDKVKQTASLFWGFLITSIFCLLRDGLFKFKSIFPVTIYPFQSFLGTEFALNLFLGPTLWAVGFMSGTTIAVPLIVGIFSKYFVLNPLNLHIQSISFGFLQIQSQNSFNMAFCSGLILTEAIIILTKVPQILFKFLNLKKLSSNNYFAFSLEKLKQSKLLKLEPILILLATFIFFSYLKFSFGAQVFIILLTILATYQISWMGGKVGLVPFGRFATFVMLPTIMFFDLTFFQITILCVFFNVCAAAASDLLFDYKIGELCNIKFRKIQKYQWAGLIITSLVIGAFFWAIFNNFQLGTPELFAYKAMARALLIKTSFFNFTTVFLGIVFGLILKFAKINPTMVLCGILMPNGLSIGLIIGGLSAIVTKNLFKQELEKFYPFWSGVFASESTWILMLMILKFLKI